MGLLATDPTSDFFSADMNDDSLSTTGADFSYLLVASEEDCSAANRAGKFRFRNKREVGMCSTNDEPSPPADSLNVPSLDIPYNLPSKYDGTDDSFLFGIDTENNDKDYCQNGALFFGRTVGVACDGDPGPETKAIFSSRVVYPYIEDCLLCTFIKVIAL